MIDFKMFVQSVIAKKVLKVVSRSSIMIRQSSW